MDDSWQASDGQWYPPPSQVELPDPSVSPAETTSDDDVSGGEIQHAGARPRRTITVILAAAIAILLGASLVGVAVIKPHSSPDSVGQFCNRVKVYAEAGRELSEPAVASSLVKHAPLQVRQVVKTTVVMMRLDDKGRQQYVLSHPNNADDPALFQEWLTVQCNL
jgi:hypothetical protein